MCVWPLRGGGLLVERGGDETLYKLFIGSLALRSRSRQNARIIEWSVNVGNEHIPLF